MRDLGARRFDRSIARYFWSVTFSASLPTGVGECDLATWRCNCTEGFTGGACERRVSTQNRQQRDPTKHTQTHARTTAVCWKANICIVVFFRGGGAGDTDTGSDRSLKCPIIPTRHRSAPPPPSPVSLLSICELTVSIHHVHTPVWPPPTNNPPINRYNPIGGFPF